jgi:hypothetical protein
MLGFKSPASAQKFLSIHAVVCNTSNPSASPDLSLDTPSFPNRRSDRLAHGSRRLVSRSLHARLSRGLDTPRKAQSGSQP